MPSIKNRNKCRKTVKILSDYTQQAIEISVDAIIEQMQRLLRV